MTWNRLVWLLLAVVIERGSAGLMGGWLGTQAKAEAFMLENLPVGKEVTLPHPATTLAKLGQQIRLIPTHIPQTVKMVTLNTRGRRERNIEVKIYDPQSPGVRVIRVQGNTPFLYQFKDLQPVRMVPVAPKGSAGGSLAYLKIESNKPLGIGR